MKELKSVLLLPWGTWGVAVPGQRSVGKSSSLLLASAKFFPLCSLETEKEGTGSVV